MCHILDKIDIVKKERAKIIQYAEKKNFGTTNLAQSMPSSPHQTGGFDDKRAASAMLEMVNIGLNLELLNFKS